MTHKRVAGKKAAEIIGCTPETVSGAFSRNYKGKGVGKTAYACGYELTRHVAEGPETAYGTKWVYTVRKQGGQRSVEKPHQKKVIEGHRYPASTLGEAMGMSSGYIHHFFKNTEKAGDTRKILGYVVTQHVASEDEGSARTKWVYTAKRIEKSEQPPSQQREETRTDVVQKSPQQVQWEDALLQVRDAEESLRTVLDAVRDVDVLRDDEMWSIVTEDRKKAMQKLQHITPKVAKLTVKNREHLYWLSKEEARALEIIRSRDISVSDLNAFKTTTTSKTPQTSADSSSVDDKGEDTAGETTAVSSLSKTEEEEPARKEYTALIYGGDPSTSARQNASRKLGFADVEWSIGKSHKRTKSLAARVANGQYRVVFGLYSYAGHTAIEQLRDACKASDALFVPVPHGYGVSMLQRAYKHAKGEKLAAHGSRGDIHA